jgi:hypothetical protein
MLLAHKRAIGECASLRAGHGRYDIGNYPPGNDGPRSCTKVSTNCRSLNGSVNRLLNTVWTKPNSSGEVAHAALPEERMSIETTRASVNGIVTWCRPLGDMLVAQ